MRTIVTQTKAYTIQELKDNFPSGFDKAYQDYISNDFQYEWYDYVYDDAKACGKILGIDIDKIYFSGFWSQGDGACFEGSYQYKKGSVKAIKEYAPQDRTLHKIAEGLWAIQKANFYRLSAYVKHSGHYYHSGCTDIQVISENHSMGGANDDAYYGIKELLRDFMNWIYAHLEQEYEYLASEEYFVELSEINEWEYTENGKLL